MQRHHDLIKVTCREIGTFISYVETIQLMLGVTDKTEYLTLPGGVQWLRSRVLDLRSRGCWFELHWKHCVLSLNNTLYPLLSTGSTQETSGHYCKIVDCVVKNQLKKKILLASVVC